MTATGRLSSRDPNLQNIPVRTDEGRRIRQAFIARDGYCIMAADYSQIELRIMAHLSQDKGLLKAFAEGKDIHRATAAEVFGVPLDEVTADQRRSAKAINFGLIYGMSAFGLARQLGSRAAKRSAIWISILSAIRACWSIWPEPVNMRQKKAMWKHLKAAVSGCRKLIPVMVCAARRLSARRSTPRCRVPQRISSKAMIAVDDWLQKRTSMR